MFEIEVLHGNAARDDRTLTTSVFFANHLSNPFSHELFGASRIQHQSYTSLHCAERAEHCEASLFYIRSLFSWIHFLDI